MIIRRGLNAVAPQPEFSRRSQAVSSFLHFLVPYRFSLLAAIVFPLTAIGYWIGRKRLAADGAEAPGPWRTFGFYLGLVSCYVVLHTRFDYYGQFVFFMHRAQHLVLHHLGALLIALGRPAVVLGAALPATFPRHAWPFRVLYRGVRIIQQPFIASAVFVGLIALWLIPSIHFAAMLSQPLYLLMNWSMLIDGVLFWLVLVDPRPPETSPMPGYGVRFMMVFGTMITQVLLGSYITFTHRSLYSIYSVCGRALPISPARDQVVGGLLTWIPPAMMEAIVMLIVLSLMMNYEKHRSTVTPAGAYAVAG